MKVEEINNYIEAKNICIKITPILQELIDNDNVGMVGCVMAMLLTGLANGIKGDLEHQKSFITRIYTTALELCDAEALSTKELN